MFLNRIGFASSGGLGNDTMVGGSGADSFVFNIALNATTNMGTIMDFAPVDDTLVLENAIFRQFVTTGEIPAGTFCPVPKFLTM